MQRSNGEFGDFQHTNVIGDGADHDKRLGVFGCVRGVSSESRKRKRRAIDAGGKEAAEDDFVEGGVGAACPKHVNMLLSRAWLYRI